MTRTRNHTRKKANAVFFSAIMVLSMFAVGFAGFAGTAAAEDAEATYVPANPWQGQDVIVFGDDIDTAEDAEYDLRRVTDSNGAVTSSSFVEELNSERATEAQANYTNTRADGDPVNEDDWIVVIDTSDLDAGDYFIRGGELPRNPNMEDTFEVRIQSLDAEFDDDTVSDTGGDSMTDLDVSSNRGTYSLNVSADGDLDNEELFEILTGLDFDDESPSGVDFSDVENQDVDSDDTYGDFNVFIYNDGQDSSDLDADEKVGMYRISDTEAEVDFAGIDGGDYEFLFEVTDTEATSTANITVDDVDDAALSFVDSTVDVAQGGVASITVEANDAADSGLLVIGEIDDYGYQLNVTIEEFNDDDRITIYFNTFAAGTSGDEDGYETPLQSIVWVDEDDEDEGAEIDYSETEEHEDSENLEFILSAGDYDMSVVALGDFDDAVDDPDDVGSLLIDEREAPAMSIWTASDDTVDDIDDVDDVLAGVAGGNVTERDLVAQDDWIIHELGANTGLDGVFHYIDRTSGVTIDDLIDSSGDADTSLFAAKNNDDDENQRAARLRIRETRDSAGPNVDRRVLTDLSDVETIIQEGESAVFLAVNTDGWNQGDSPFNDEDRPVLDDEEDYEFNTNFRIEDNWLLEFDVDDDEDLIDLFETAESTYDVEERTGAFVSDPYNVTATEDVQIVATTNVAPGTELTIRARSSGDTRPSFIKSQTDLVVSQDEDVTGTFDFSDTNVGDTFDLTLRPTNQFPDDVEADGNVVDAVDDDTPTPTPEDTPTPTPDEETPTPTPDEETPTPDEETPEPTDDDTPGFGAVVALVALVAAALLATRRRP